VLIADVHAINIGLYSVLIAKFTGAETIADFNAARFSTSCTLSVHLWSTSSHATAKLGYLYWVAMLHRRCRTSMSCNHSANQRLLEVHPKKLALCVLCSPASSFTQFPAQLHHTAHYRGGQRA
jgi:hypothetical protein